MKKIILIIILTIMFFIGLIVLTGCSEVEADNSRFVEIDKSFYFKTVYDKETKVQYAVSSSPYNYGTVTLLVDAEGKPLLYKGE